MTTARLSLATLLCIAACGRDSAPPADSTPAATRPESSVARPAAAGSDTAPSAATRDPARPPATRDSTPPSSPPMQAVGVSEQGVGPIRIGMALAEVRHATASTIIAPPAADTASCGYATWPRGLPGLRFMTAKGRVVRIDVDSGRTATAEGARIGDSEARIGELYAGKVESTPSKYTAGHSLKIRKGAAGDTNYRIIFETDGKRVTKYRAGRMPELGYVEGCG